MQYCVKYPSSMSPKEAGKTISCRYMGLYSGALTPNEVNAYCFLNERSIKEDNLPFKECKK
jgi:hypothetical protein